MKDHYREQSNATTPAPDRFAKMVHGKNCSQFGWRLQPGRSECGIGANAS